MSFSVHSFEEKAKSRDKDLRHMALYDLSVELEKPAFKLDDTNQRKVSGLVLELLDDTSNEVQGMAVKCLAPLVAKMSKSQIENCVQRLSSNLVKGDEEKRDIAATSLKIIIAKVPADIAQGPIQNCMDALVEALKGDNVDVKGDALDILEEILKRFGGIVSANHAELQKLFINELETGRANLKKRAINCLAALSANSNDELFNTLVTKVLSEIENSSSEGGEKLRIHIQCASALSKTAGHRLGKYLHKIVPLLLKAADDIAENDEEIEVRENIMQAFENFIIQCPDEMKDYLEFVIILGKEYIEYDPNYSYDSDDEEEGEDEEDEEEGEDDEEGGHSDDDDISWKVRKAAAKSLQALVKYRPEALELVYKDLNSAEEPTLVGRFKEREEGVKLDIFNLFIAICQQTIIQKTDASGEVVIEQKPEVKYLKETIDIIMKRVKKQLKEKNLKIKTHLFKVLRELTITLQGGLGDYANILIPGVQQALQDPKSNSTLKLEALAFLEKLLSTHPPETFREHIHSIAPAVYACAAERYYKLISQALRVCSELVPVFATDRGQEGFENKVKDLYTAVLDRLVVQDIDQDVKEAAIEAAGRLVSELGDTSHKQVDEILNLLLDRLKNETTRLTACKTLGVIARSKLGIDLSKVLNGIMEELGSFLRKNNRQLRQASLQILSTLAKSNQKITTQQFSKLISEVAGLLQFTGDKDLHLSHLALDLCVNIINANNKAAVDVQKQILPKALELLESSTLQGAALDSLLRLLQTVLPNVGFNSLFNSVLEAIKKAPKPVAKQVYTNVGKGVAALTQKASEKEAKATVEKFVKDLKSSDEVTKMLALFTLGEIGHNSDLSAYKIQSDIQACFEESEEIKNAAAFALGNVAVGSLQQYLPSIIKEIREGKKHRYQLIHALKEVITQATHDKLKPFINDVLPLLFEYADNEEEGVRNVVSECLGKLALVDYSSVIEKLKEALSGPEFKKSTVISAIRYTVTEKPREFDAQLTKDITTFLKLLNKSENVAVRRAAVLLLTSAVHNKPTLVYEALDSLLPNLYAETATDQSLIKTVNLGPFKHVVDEGVDLRKSVFECLDTLLDTCFNRLDANKFIAQLPNGLTDKNEDINMLTHIMIEKLAEKAPSNLLTALDQMIEPLRKTLTTKPKDNAVQTEKERHTDLLKSSLRAVYAISKIQGIQDSVKFNELLTKTVKANNVLNELYNKVASEDQSIVDSF